MTLKTDNNWASNKTTRPRAKRAEANTIVPCGNPYCTMKTTATSRYAREGRVFCSGLCVRFSTERGGSQ